MAAKNPYGQNLIPTLIVNGAAEAIELYKQAFGATETARFEYADGSGKIMWACVEIGGNKLFLMDANKEMCAEPTTSSFYLYADDVDAAFAKAKAAGMTEKMPPQDVFYGDRVGNLTDKFGIAWTLSQHIRDVSDEEMREAVKQMGKAA